MELSDDTIKKIQAILDRASEITRQFPTMTKTEALMCSSSIMTAREIMAVKELAERIDAQQGITAEEVTAIHRDTTKSAGILKSFVSIFKFGGEEVKRH